ncbi:MAG TPA: M24 family metallopeptidase, partial [Acidimicrobiia bacterium]
YSDTTRTFVVGEPSEEQSEVHSVVAAAQARGRETARPGVTAESVDAATRSVIEDAGYGEYFIHRTGHGIGLEGHEHPYLVAGNDLVLEPGMAFSIEPGIYLPDRFGIRIEDICVLDESGLTELNSSERALVSVG